MVTIYIYKLGYVSDSNTYWVERLYYYSCDVRGSAFIFILTSSRLGWASKSSKMSSSVEFALFFFHKSCFADWKYNVALITVCFQLDFCQLCQRRCWGSAAHKTLMCQAQPSNFLSLCKKMKNPNKQPLSESTSHLFIYFSYINILCCTIVLSRSWIDMTQFKPLGYLSLYIYLFIFVMWF